VRRNRVGSVEHARKGTPSHALMVNNKMEVNSAILKSSLTKLKPDLLGESVVSIPKKDHAIINQVISGMEYTTDSDGSIADRVINYFGKTDTGNHVLLGRCQA
jgi:hypothetical protein